MEVNAKVLNREGNELTMEITAAAADLEQAITTVLRKAAKEVKIPGFRPGKVPAKMLEGYIGEQALLQEALDEMLQPMYIEAINQTDIFPVDRPHVDVQQLARGQEVKLTFKVTVKPEVKLGKYKGVEVEKELYVPTEEDIDNEIKHMQERIAHIIDLPAGTAMESGDTAIIDFEGFIDGVAFEGGKGEKYSLTLGSNTFIPGFEDQLVGVKTGDSVDVNVTFPEDYHSDDLAGKPAVFKVLVHEARRRELPPVDDDFVKDMREDCDTVAELREKLREELNEKAEAMATQNAQNKALEQVVANAEMDVPSIMIDDRLDQMLQEFEGQLQYQGLTLERFFQLTKSTRAEWRAAQQDRAEEAVKQDLVLEAIVKAEDIQAEQEDLDKQMQEIADSYNKPLEEVKATFADNGRLQFFEYNIKMLKAIELINENAVIK
ncbi:MAG: trigger factor [Peptococcaceae bacterium]|jgi:trigger factor|nr:trigger factor [Peptococcaceae bacterium]